MVAKVAKKNILPSTVSTENFQVRVSAIKMHQKKKILIWVLYNSYRLRQELRQVLTMLLHL
jgi:hypothetical protein